MKITYEKILEILNSKFKLVKGKKKSYFLDDSERIVATVDKNLITMFYDFPKHSREIWNHEGKVAVAFVKNFNVNGQICDVVCTHGLCGACNDFTLHDNYFIDDTNNTEMRYLLDVNDNSLQKKFESLSYEEKIDVLETFTGAKFTGANISGIQLFPSSERYRLGNCGHLTAKNGIAKFDIFGQVEVNNIVISKKDSFDLNIIDLKNEYQSVNYKKVYDFYREKYAWYYSPNGYAFSEDIRAFIDRRKNSTVDEDAIHFSQPRYDLLDEIYINGKQSLNSKRMQMIYTLKSLLKIKRTSAVNYVSSHYDFQLRNCDLTNQRAKTRKN